MKKKALKPLSYTDLSTYQLLCIKDVYQMMDNLCMGKLPSWDIVNFEKAIVSSNVHCSFDEETVREIIKDGLLKLDEEKTLKRYLEDGKHYAYELFMYLPENFHITQKQYILFWAYMAREFSDLELPVDAKRFREKYITVMKQFNFPYDTGCTRSVERFSVKTKYGVQNELDEAELRQALYILEARNRAFMRERDYDGEKVYLGKAIEELSAFAERVWPSYRVRKDLNIHDFLFALDSTCTEASRDDVLALWGVFTGEPMSFTACGRRRGVTGSRIRQTQVNVISRVGNRARRIILEPKEEKK